MSDGEVRYTAVDQTEVRNSGPAHPEALTEERKAVPHSFPLGGCWGGVKPDQAFRFLVGQPQGQVVGTRTARQHPKVWT
jgi:hypothetical protein